MKIAQYPSRSPRIQSRRNIRILLNKLIVAISQAEYITTLLFLLQNSTKIAISVRARL
jgi:hypothetical protein